jgi:hypothetical protein
MDQLKDTPRILSSVRCHTCSSVWLETATFPLRFFSETLARRMMVGGLTVEALALRCIYMDIDSMGYYRWDMKSRKLS